MNKESISLRWREWFLTHYQVHSVKGKQCPRRVAGKQCLAFRTMDAWCACQSLGSVHDHAEMWKTDDGGYIYTTQPYSLSGDGCAAVLQVAEELNLSVLIDARSFYNPGATVLIILTQTT